ncbi:zinc-dependent peptidase [soil metagenome]
MPFLRQLKRFLGGRRAFPAEMEKLLYQKVRIYRQLNSRRKQLVQERLKVFMNEKIFEGCGGLTLNDEMRVVISAYACVLILEESADYYPGLQSILVYPDDYVAPVYEENPGGVVTEGSERRQGESWDTGSVVLSWADILDTTQSSDNNQNLVVHEFAHQLDLQYGLSTAINIDGRVLNEGDEWTEELAKTYRELIKNARFGRKDGVLDLYGATNPAECFAVLMEAFIESPRDLETSYPKIYRMLTEFFRINPGRW